MLRLSVSQWRNSAPIDRGGALLPFPSQGDFSIGFAAYREKEDKIELLIDRSGNVYDIACDRILTAGGFLDFLLQVHSKEWATPQHIYDLLDVVTCWTYRDHGKFPQLFFDVAGGMNEGMGT